MKIIAYTMYFAIAVLAAAGAVLLSLPWRLYPWPPLERAGVALLCVTWWGLER